jgi:hypothetical protein
MSEKPESPHSSSSLSVSKLLALLLLTVAATGWRARAAVV